MAETTYTIRPIEEGDIPFIYNSWLKSYRDAPAVRTVPNHIYYTEHHEIIENILKSPYSETLVACSVENPDILYGYATGEHFEGLAVVHWVYCKQEWRRKGVAGALLRQLVERSAGKPIQYSHFTRFIKKLKEDHDITYNPYALPRN